MRGAALLRRLRNETCREFGFMLRRRRFYSVFFFFPIYPSAYRCHKNFVYTFAVTIMTPAIRVVPNVSYSPVFHREFVPRLISSTGRQEGCELASDSPVHALTLVSLPLKPGASPSSQSWSTYCCETICHTSRRLSVEGVCFRDGGVIHPVWSRRHP